jgi:hypothetical protein
MIFQTPTNGVAQISRDTINSSIKAEENRNNLLQLASKNDFCRNSNLHQNLLFKS